MKIVLIDPKGIVPGLNTGLGYMSAILSSGNNDVKVIDFNNKSGNEDERLKETKDADFVGLSIKSFTLEHSVKIARKVREINPDAKIIAGGPHVTIDGHDFLKENNDFDFAVMGETENIASKIFSGDISSSIRGVISRNTSAKEKNTGIADIDAIPFPVYDNFDSFHEKIELYPLVTSRGCPYQCTYCSVGDVIGKKWRFRSPKNVVEELKRAKEKYGSIEFRVLDDNFTLDINRAKEICRLLIEENVNMRWACPNGIRADRIDKELLELMKKSGCYSISFGIESAVEDVFDMINKGEKLEKVKQSVKMAKDIGMRVEGFFIIGLPGSTYEKDKQSIGEAKKMKLDSASWGVLVPYPGTEVWDWLNKEISKGNARMLRNWKEGFHIGFRPRPVFETTDYSASERIKAFYLANLKTLGFRAVPLAFKILLKR